MYTHTRLLIVASLLLVSACSTTPPSRHYLLEAMPATAPASVPDQPLRLGIGNIALPDYLNRPQIVVRDSGSQLQLRQGERWAEPLDEGVRRVLTENLGQQLGTSLVVQLPAPPGVAVDRRLHLEILRFDASTQGEVRLHARWSLLDDKNAQAGGRLYAQQIRIALPDAGTASMLAAMNSALQQLAGHIAGSLNDNAPLHPVTPPGNPRR